MIWGDLGKGQREERENGSVWMYVGKEEKKERAKGLTKADEEILFFFFLSRHCHFC